MMSAQPAPLSYKHFDVGWICAIEPELVAARAVLDEVYEENLPKLDGDHNDYLFGRIGSHNVVITPLPSGTYGTNVAVMVATQLARTFPSLKYRLLVGVGAGVPNLDCRTPIDIRLGDVVVSDPGSSSGVVQYDLGKTNEGERWPERIGSSDKPPVEMRTAVAKLKAKHRFEESPLLRIIVEAIVRYPRLSPEYTYQGAANDVLFQSQYKHVGSPRVHYGTIGSGNQVVKDSVTRDYWQEKEKIICFEMEAAGLMDHFRCLVIRGICDYADSHKNHMWQPYAALTAAAYAKDLILGLAPGSSEASTRATDRPKNPLDLGLDLNDAPEMPAANFVGRKDELEVLRKELVPMSNASGQRIVILLSLGGMGKTQLAISFAKLFQDCFSAIFWLDARSEAALRNSMLTIAERVAPQNFSKNPNSVEDEDLKIRNVRTWLSQKENVRWLLIYDNYDCPEVTGKDSKDTYNIRNYFPQRTQGSILITTRSGKVRFGTVISLKKLETAQAVDLLAQRSLRRSATSDHDALRLAERLDGLPLALATAGDYLRQTTISFAEYLENYEAKWQELEEIAEELEEYQDRTLYSTWNLSLARLAETSPDSVTMLKLLAYFNNNDIWFELLQYAPSEKTDTNLDFLRSKIRFGAIMKRLQDYSLVESHESTGRYSLHTCVHDWTLDSLNRTINPELYWTAFLCIAKVYKKGFVADGRPYIPRLLPHALRLRHRSLRDFGKDSRYNNLPTYLVSMGSLFKEAQKFNDAEALFLQSLQYCIDTRGTQGSAAQVSVQTLSELGELYTYQNRFTEAEAIYQGALEALKHIPSADFAADFGQMLTVGLTLLYSRQGRVNDAKRILLQALKDKEQTQSQEELAAPHVALQLARVYQLEGNLKEAEELYCRALEKYKAIRGSTDSWTLHVVLCLGKLYAEQGKLTQAENMLVRAVEGFTKATGPGHLLTLTATAELGNFFKQLGRFAESETLQLQAFHGLQDVFGLNHSVTLNVARNLGALYLEMGKHERAVEMLTLALQWKGTREL